MKAIFILEASWFSCIIIPSPEENARLCGDRVIILSSDILTQLCLFFHVWFGCLGRSKGVFLKAGPNDGVSAALTTVDLGHLP